MASAVGISSIGLIVTPLFIMTAASILNQNWQTQAALYATVIGVSVVAGTVAGVTVFGTGGDSTTTIIIFMETALGAAWLVMSAGNLNYWSTMPVVNGLYPTPGFPAGSGHFNLFSIGFWPPIYTVLSVFYVIGMAFAPRAIN